MRGPKPKTLGRFILHRFDLSRKKLDNHAAFSADHMIVMLVIVVMFVVGLVITKSDLAGQSCFGKQFQCPVNSGVPDRGICLMYQPMKILDR